MLQPISIESPIDAARKSPWSPAVRAGFLLAFSGVLAILAVTQGIKALPMALVLVWVLPWLVRAPYRLYLWLIVSWPVVSLYAYYELPAGLPDIRYERVVILALVALVIVAAIVSRKAILPLGNLVTTYLVLQGMFFAMGLGFGALVRPNLSSFISVTLLPIAMYWLTRHFITTRRHLWGLIGSIAVAGFVVCLTGLYEHLLDLPDSPFPVTPFNKAGATRFGGVPGGRAAGVVANPAIYGALMGIALTAMLCLFVHTRRVSLRVLLSVAIPIVVYGVFASYTRSAWLAVLVALCLAQFYLRDLWKKGLPTIGIAVVTIVVAWGVLSHNDVVQSRVMETDNVVGRVERAVWSWEKFLEKPILGWGSGALNALMGREFPADGFSTSHNTYLTILVDYGAIVFLCLMALMGRWLLRAATMMRALNWQAPERSALAVMASILVIYMISGLALEVGYFKFFNALLWIAAAVIDNLWSLYRQSKAEPFAEGTEWATL